MADTVQVVDPVEGNVAYGPRTAQSVSAGQTSRVAFTYVPVTGALRYVVTGLPSGLAARIDADHTVLTAGVLTMGATSLRLNGSAVSQVGSDSPKRISMLLVGDWTVGAHQIFTGGTNYCPTVPQQQVRVEGAKTSVVRVTYVACRN